MPRAPGTIEIGEMPEVLRMAEQVRKKKAPRLLSRHNKPVAVLQPLGGKRKGAKSAKSKKDYDAFLASAASWREVDTDKLIKDIYESRRISSRPPVSL